MTHVLYGNQTLLWRRLGLTDGAERSASAAVTRVVQLEHDPGGIANEHLGCVAALCDHPHLHRCHARARGTCRLLARDAMLRQNLEDLVDLELLDAHAETADARLLTRSGGHDGEEPRTGADSQVRRRSLPGLNRHAEESLVKIDRASGIRHAERQLAQSIHANLRRAPPCAIRRCAAIRAGMDARKLRRSIGAVMGSSSFNERSLLPRTHLGTRKFFFSLYPGPGGA